MKVIDWRSWLCDPLAQISPRVVQSDDYLWEDPVTQIIFAIKQNDYDSLLKHAEHQMHPLDADTAFARWNSMPYPFGEVSDDALSLHIPYPAPIPSSKWSQYANDSVRYRLTDFVLLRAGLFYALFNPSKTAWPELRQQLLQVKPSLLEYQEQVASVDRYLTEGVVDQRWAEKRLSLVKAGAVKIKQYYLETNNIQEIRGASRLLEEISRERISNYLKEVASEESIVYNGGGNLLIILPESTGEVVAMKIESMYREITGTAQAIAYAASVSWSDLDRSQFAATLNWIELKKSERQMTVGIRPAPAKLNPDLYISAKTVENSDRYKMIDKTTYIHDLKNNNEDTAVLLVKGRIPVCKSCRLREATHFFIKHEDSFAQCPSCFQKMKSGNSQAELSFHDEIKKLVSQYKPALAEHTLVVADDLDQIAGNSNKSKQPIAVVYGDGNNMGHVVEKIYSLIGYRYFSILVDQITKLAVYTTVMETCKMFELIAVGGDDVFLVVPGNLGLEVASEIGRKFDLAFAKHHLGEQGHSKEGLTMSLGIAIGDCHIPFPILYRTTSQLLSSAKEIKKKQKIAWVGGSLDFMVLQGASSCEEGLQTHRNHYRKQQIEQKGGAESIVTSNFLLRPYTFDQTKVMIHFLSQVMAIPGARSVIHHLRSILPQLTPEEARQYYKFYMLTDRERDHQRAKIHGLVEKFVPAGYIRDDLFFRKERDNEIELRSPWHDLWELWTVYERSEKQNEA